MPRDVDYSSVQSRIEECLDSIPDTVADRARNDDGEIVRWLVERDPFRYTVNKAGDADHVVLMFEYNILNTVAQLIDVSDAKRILRGEDVDESDLSDDELLLVASEFLLDSTPPEVMNNFANGLIQLISHPGVGFNFENTDSGAIAMFRVTKNIHPYSDDFRFKEFDEAAQTVITIGNSAAIFTQRCLDIESAVEERTPAERPGYIQ